jgi:hypothetical protein
VAFFFAFQGVSLHRLFDVIPREKGMRSTENFPGENRSFSTAGPELKADHSVLEAWSIMTPAFGGGKHGFR